MDFMGAKILEYPSRSIVFDESYCKYKFWSRLIINVSFNNCFSCHIHDSPSHLL